MILKELIRVLEHSSNVDRCVTIAEDMLEGKLTGDFKSEESIDACSSIVEEMLAVEEDK